MKFILATTEFQDVPGDHPVALPALRLPAHHRRRPREAAAADLRKREDRSRRRGAAGASPRSPKAGFGTRSRSSTRSCRSRVRRSSLGDLDRALGLMDVERLRALVVAVGQRRRRPACSACSTMRSERAATPKDSSPSSSICSGTRWRRPRESSRAAHPAGAPRSSTISGPRSRSTGSSSRSASSSTPGGRSSSADGDGFRSKWRLLKLARSVDLVPWQDVLEKLEGGGGGEKAQENTPLRESAPMPRPVPAPSKAAAAGRMDATAASGARGAGLRPASLRSGLDRFRRAPPPASPQVRSRAGPEPPSARGDPRRLGAGQAALPGAQSEDRRHARGGRTCGRCRADPSCVSLPAARAFLQKSLESPAYRDVVEDVLSEASSASVRGCATSSRGRPRRSPRPDEQKKDVHPDPAVRKVVDALDGGVIHVEQDRG